MGKTAFYNSDGDFLIVPHKGKLFIYDANSTFGTLKLVKEKFIKIPDSKPIMINNSNYCFSLRSL